MRGRANPGYLTTSPSCLKFGSCLGGQGGVVRRRGELGVNVRAAINCERLGDGVGPPKTIDFELGSLSFHQNEGAKLRRYGVTKCPNMVWIF